MTLATHIVAGAAGAKILASNPIGGFLLGFASHFVLDAIAHWDYPLASARSELFEANAKENISIFNKAMIKDVLKVSFDAFLGFLFVFLFLQNPAEPNYLILIAGGIGGAVPDFLQFVFLLWKAKPVVWLQEFHHEVHSKKNFNNQPFLGITLQLILILVFIILFRG